MNHSTGSKPVASVVTAESRSFGLKAVGCSHHSELIIRLRWSLVLDIFHPYFIGHISTCRYPIPPRPHMLTPVSLLQCLILTHQFMRTLPFQVLHSFRDRHIRGNPYQHMHVVPVNRPCVNPHLFTDGYLPQQLTTSIPHIPLQNRISILRRPHNMIFTIPYGMPATLVSFHPSSLSQIPAA